MQNSEKQAEPSMDEILASIRKIIAEDPQAAPSQAEATATATDTSDAAAVPGEVSAPPSSDLSDILGEPLDRPVSPLPAEALLAETSQPASNPAPADAHPEPMTPATEPETPAASSSFEQSLARLAGAMADPRPASTEKPKPADSRTDETSEAVPADGAADETLVDRLKGFDASPSPRFGRIQSEPTMSPGEAPAFREIVPPAAEPLPEPEDHVAADATSEGDEADGGLFARLVSGQAKAGKTLGADEAVPVADLGANGDDTPSMQPPGEAAPADQNPFAAAREARDGAAGDAADPALDFASASSSPSADETAGNEKVVLPHTLEPLSAAEDIPQAPKTAGDEAGASALDDGEGSEDGGYVTAATAPEPDSEAAPVTDTTDARADATQAVGMATAAAPAVVAATTSGEGAPAASSPAIESALADLIRPIVTKWLEENAPRLIEAAVEKQRADTE